MRLLCYLRHDWMLWSDLFPCKGHACQGRLCRRCGRYEVRRVS